MKFSDDFLHLKTQDYPSYLTILLMKASLRDLITPLFCLATELKRIPFVTSELTGLIRLRWWQDQILAHQQGKNTHDLLQKLPPFIQWERLQTIIQGHEHFIELSSIQSNHEVNDLAQKIDIPLLHLGYELLNTTMVTAKDEQILNQIGLILTSSHLYLQRTKLIEKGFGVHITNQSLIELIKYNIPNAFTPTTSWLSPLSGYGKALYDAFKKGKKPTLITLQSHMIWAYIRAKLKF